LLQTLNQTLTRNKIGKPIQDWILQVFTVLIPFPYCSNKVVINTQQYFSAFMPSVIFLRLVALSNLPSFRGFYFQARRSSESWASGHERTDRDEPPQDVPGQRLWLWHRGGVRTDKTNIPDSDSSLEELDFRKTGFQPNFNQGTLTKWGV
jgi:hypothetical protein